MDVTLLHQTPFLKRTPDVSHQTVPISLVGTTHPVLLFLLRVSPLLLYFSYDYLEIFNRDLCLCQGPETTTKETPVSPFLSSSPGLLLMTSVGRFRRELGSSLLIEISTATATIRVTLLFCLPVPYSITASRSNLGIHWSVTRPHHNQPIRQPRRRPLAPFLNRVVIPWKHMELSEIFRKSICSSSEFLLSPQKDLSTTHVSRTFQVRP